MFFIAIGIHPSRTTLTTSWFLVKLFITELMMLSIVSHCQPTRFFGTNLNFIHCLGGIFYKNFTFDWCIIRCKLHEASEVEILRWLQLHLIFAINPRNGIEWYYGFKKHVMTYVCKSNINVFFLFPSWQQFVSSCIENVFG